MLWMLLACGPPDGARVTVAVDPDTRAGLLDERYLGYAFDTAQFTGAYWWEAGNPQRVAAPLPDLASPRLRTLTRQLAPGRLRVGGTDCNSFWFCEEDGDDCTLPAAYEDRFLDTSRHDEPLPRPRLAEVATFAEAVDARVLMCLNVGPGPRRPDGSWDPENSRDLMRFATRLPEGEVFDAWEPGNEMNVAGFNFAFDGEAPTAETFADDLVAFRRLVDAEDPGALVPAPGSFIAPDGEFGTFTTTQLAEVLEARGQRDLLDGWSWHRYATQSTACPVVFDAAEPDVLLSESLTDRHRAVAEEVRAAAGEAPIWNTETASAQCGGQAGLSDTMADALWWADWIGVNAEHGSRVVIRHSLVGADYSLIGPGPDYEARPAWLASVLYARHVRTARLHTEADREQIKAHAFCGTERDTVTLVLANPGAEKKVVDLRLDARRATQYTLAPRGDWTSTEARLDGVGVRQDGTLPRTEGERVRRARGQLWPVVPGHAVVFVVIEAEGACVREAGG